MLWFLCVHAFWAKLYYMLRMRALKSASDFLRDELGADLTETLLIVAFAAMAGAAVYTTAGTSVSNVWTTASSQITASTATIAAGSPVNSGSGSGGDGSRRCRDNDGHECH